MRDKLFLERKIKMFGTTNHFRSAKFLIALVLGGCAATSVAAWSLNAHSVPGQGREKTIDKAFTRNEVVEFSEIKVSQKSVEAGKKFDEDDEWLHKVLLRVKNISDKPIVFLEVAVDFPETTATGSVMSYPLRFGQMPGSKIPQKRDPIFMMPGDTLQVSLDKDYTKIKSFVEHRHPITGIRKAELSVGFVVFADKTGWAAGNYYRQDPNNPDHYINIGDKPAPSSPD
jgi:hypothetical protein